MDTGDLDHLLDVARTGSLSAAAKHRGVAVSTVARRLDALEAALGLRLLDRGAGGARLTAHGQQIAGLAGPIADQADRIARAAAALREGERAVPIRISATEPVAADVLAPALPLLWARGATFPVHLIVSNEVVSLAGRAADIAVRMVRPTGASLVARKLPTIRLGLFASTAYLAGRDPAALDLRAERLLLYDDSYGRIPELDWMGQAGLAGAAQFRTSSTRALVTAAAAGAGIAILPAAFARDTALIEVPLARAPPPRTPWIVTDRSLRRHPSIRVAQAWIAETFARMFR